jgi:hypothetical protein
VGVVGEERRGMTVPTPTDPEVAAVTFKKHLDDFFANGRPSWSTGWARHPVDELHEVVEIPGIRADGTIDPYFVTLGAEYYPVWPVSAAFVHKTEAGGWEPVSGGPWWPRQNNQPGFAFGLHTSYDYLDGVKRPLICLSFTLQYYFTAHGPADDERWDPSRHTLSATLTRLGDVLKAPNYQEPDGDRSP